MTLHKIELIILVSLFLFKTSAFAQYPDTTLVEILPSKKIGKPIEKSARVQYFFKYLDLEQGLNNSYILCFLEDKKGNIWYGTDGDGAGKFDGKKITVYNTQNGLTHNTVEQIIEDRKGNIWFATFGGGLGKFDGIKYTWFNKKNGLPDNLIWSVFEDSKGTIWIATENGGLAQYDGKKMKIYNIENGLCYNRIRTIFEDSHNQLWFGSDGGGVSCFNGENFKNYTEYEGLSNNKVLAIDEDKHGNIWFGTYGGGICSIINGKFKTYTEKNGLTNNFVCDIICCKDENIWIATSGGGVNCFDGKKFTPFTVAEGLSNNIVISLLEDRYKNIWIGTYGGGINTYSASHFNYFGESEGLSKNIIKTILEDKQGTYWFGASGGGICSYNGEKFSNYRSVQGFPSDWVMTSVIDNNGNKWFGTSGGGVCKMDNQKFYYLTKGEGLTSDYILSLLVDKTNKLWIGAYGGGVSCFDGKKLIHFDKKTGLEGIFVYALAERSNKIYVGTEKGLFVIDKNKAYKMFINQIDSTPVKSLYIDNLNHLWIGTNGKGLFIFDGKTCQPFYANKQLTCQNIESIKSDLQNNIWVGTTSGLIKIKPINPIQINNIEGCFLIKNYQTTEGFTGNNCMTNALFVDTKNHVWIGTGRKLTLYKPELEKENKLAPSIQLDNIKMFLKSVNWLAEKDSGKVVFNKLLKWNNLPINLISDYNQNHFTFCFSGISQNCPEKIKYQFILEGIDKTWSPITEKNEITYSNLPAGKYTFKVISINENAIKSTMPAIFSFAISPPWWQELWARIIAITILIALFLAIIKLRERKLRADKRKLEQTIKERTIEITQQKEEIQAQKQHIECIHKEVTDSIHYAQHIQKAVLPNTDYLNAVLENYFVLFKPKDVVSGDFFWCSKHENKIIVAVADCTGHGVPGAFMSMLGISFLNEIVNKKKILQADQILNHLRTLVIESLSQRGESGEQKDGMDISLLVLNTQTLEGSWAGANNPIYIFKKETEQELLNQLIEIKGNKMPIAIHERMEPFTNHQLQFNKGDSIYLFSDGFADQFGGKEEKKFKTAKLKQLLMSIKNDTADQQKNRLNNELEAWKGNLEQTDDILLIGIKLN